MGLLTAKLLRRKVIEAAPGNLARKLGVFDLMGLGIGATLGAGVYVLTGVIAKNEAGPSTILSFLISGFASVLSGLCYAEFGARVPRAGSAYVYSYVTVGELLAWTTGWQLLLEYIIGASSVARAWSGYVDSLAGGRISAGMAKGLGTWAVPGLAADPDFLAAGMTLLLSGLVSFGVRESTAVNNVLTVINVAVIIFVIIAGSFYADTKNFTPFAPFGVSGVFKGAATSFFAFVGFDVIATSAEEAIDPARVIPIAIISSLLICAVAYMGVSGVVTLMVPYNMLDSQAPLSSAFASHGAEWARYIISVGAVAGLSTSLMTCIFPMPRIIYAIADDGLLPPWVGAVSPRFNTPAVATMLCGSFAAIMALIFDINALADMMSIGTMISYTLVAASVLVLRYMKDPVAVAPSGVSAAGEAGGAEAVAAAGERGPAVVAERKSSFTSGLASLGEGLLSKCSDGPGGGGAGDEEGALAPRTFLWGRSPAAAAGATIVTYCLTLSLASVPSVIMTGGLVELTPALTALFYACIGVGLALSVACIAVLLAIPSRPPVGLAFTCPGMPWTPLLSIAINVYLLVSLSPFTWIRFVVWCIVGALIYGFYGISHSRAPYEDGTRQIDLDRRRDNSGGGGAREGVTVSLASLPRRGGGGVSGAADKADESDEQDMLMGEHTPLTGGGGQGSASAGGGAVAHRGGAAASAARVVKQLFPH